MILWNFKSPSTVYDANTALSGIVDKGNYAEATASKFVMTHNDERVVFRGDFDVAGNEPVDGTITSIKVYNAGILLLEISGISVDVEEFKARRADYNQEDEVIDLFRAGPTKMTGTAGTDHIEGGARADTILGRAGSDDLYGNRGNDWIDSGGHSDQMTGGAGRDKFVFKAALGDGDDQITDFSHKSDTILLDHDIFRKLNDEGQVKAAFFRVGAEAVDGNDFLIYDDATGNLYYDKDGSGDAFAQVLFGNLTNVPQNVAANDFLMV